ncbi:MAG: HRDC domain-containing protein [Bacteroidales bacterium]|nr:HRDC domain-containing protein [Bacteroidales bacterium]
MSEISPYGIKSDITIKEFNAEAESNPPTQEQLDISKSLYQKDLIIDQFDFNELKKYFYYFKKIFNENANKFENTLKEVIDFIEITAKKDIFEISDKFIAQINYLINSNNTLPQENNALQERIKKASGYYLEKIEEIFNKNFSNVYFDSDNKEIRKTISDAIEKLEKAIYTKKQSLSKSLDGFDTQIYLKSVSDADIDFKPVFNKKTVRSASTFQTSEHYDLYAEINAWRKLIAEESGIPLYMVLPQKTLKEIIEKLPSDLKQLSKIKGFGKVKLNQYGEDILEIIDSYCERNDIQRNETEIEELKPEKAPKADTKLLSLEMFREGKNINEIAESRGLVESTIFGHLSYFISKGELEITSVLSKEKVEEITNYLNEKKHTSLRQLYEEADRKYSYNELKLVINYLKIDIYTEN